MAVRKGKHYCSSGEEKGKIKFDRLGFEGPNMSMQLSY